MSRTVAEREDRGRADEFRVASELCRRKKFAALMMGNVPNGEVLCSSSEANAAICIQVKTFRAHEKTCIVGENTEIDCGENFMWVLAGLRDEEHDSCEESLDAFLLCDELKKAINQMFLNPPEEIKTSILDTFEKEPPILCVKK